MQTSRVARRLLIALDAFLAVTAVAGGIGLLTGILAAPLALLQGSPFGSYIIPGLALLVIVGGSALVATVLMIRRHALGAVLSGMAGAMIIGFEIVEVLVIGSEAGVARNLQIFYFAFGLAMAAVALWCWTTEHTARPSSLSHGITR
jgi:hypothetical protein